MSREIQLIASGVTVGSSLTAVDVSKPFVPADKKELNLKILLSAAAISNGITFKVQDSFDNGLTFYDIGDQSEAPAVKKTFAAGTAEKNTITAPATAGVTQGDFFIHSTVARSIAVWLDIDAAGTTPAGALFLATTAQIKVGIVTGDTASQVATKLRAALAGQTDITVTGATTAVIIENVVTGAATDVARYNAAEGGSGSFEIATTTAGSNGGVDISTNAVTSTSHGFATGDYVYISGTLPAGLSAGNYYIIKTDANTVKFASTQADALAGTAADLTGYGSSTCAIYGAAYEVRMIAADTTDLAQLPLWSPCKVVVTTGVSDSVTVSKIYLSE